MAKSIFDPTSKDEPMRGGLDTFLGPKASDYSNMPDAIAGQEADEEDPERPHDAVMHCDGSESEQDVCKIKEALDERLHSESGGNPTATDAVHDGPG